MNNPTMLYKSPGPHDIHGGKFDYVIVDEEGVDAALKDGWSLTTPEALAKAEAVGVKEAVSTKATKTTK
jgi:hypothetical protein